MEWFDVCDENGQPTGETVSRDTAHRDGVLHRTAHVWVTRPHSGKWEVLLQKRSRNKDSHPGCWDTSSAGHIPAGSGPLPSAIRELNEELGILTTADRLAEIGRFCVDDVESFHGKPFHDHEYIFVYIFLDQVDTDRLVLQESEVESAAWFGLEELSRAVSHSQKDFCVPPESLVLLTEYLRTQTCPL